MNPTSSNIQKIERELLLFSCIQYFMNLTEYLNNYTFQNNYQEVLEARMTESINFLILRTRTPNIFE